VPTFPSLGPATPGTAAIRLDEIEREVASRAGPFLYEQAYSGATANTVVVRALQSTINNIEWQKLYLLRRGVMKSSGTAIGGFNTDDRIRSVKTQTALSGTLLVDRDWNTPPVNGEAIELHHLHPEWELRRGVRNGLRRCYFVDRSAFTLSSAAVERNITLLAPWITAMNQIYGVQYMPTGGLTLPRDVKWWEPFLLDNSVWIKSSDPYPNQMLIISRRSHFTWVNGNYAAGGPVLDSDLLGLSLAYAAAAGHIETWRIAKARMAAAAQEGNAVTQQEAATEFTRQAQDNFNPPNQPTIQFSLPSSTYIENNENAFVVVE